MATTNFNIREITVDDKFDELVVSSGMVKSDYRMAEREDVIVAADANITLTNTGNTLSQVCNFTIRVRDPSTLLTATRGLIFPVGMKGRWIVHNLTAQQLDVNCGGVAVAVAAGVVADLYSDGVDVFELGNSSAGGGGGGSSILYDFAFFFWQQPAPGVEIMRIVWDRSIVLRAGLPLSQGNCLVAPTNPTTYNLQRNGVLIGTADFAAAAFNATFTLGADTVFTAGDVFSVIAPSPQDTTQANIGFMLHAERL